MRAHYRARSPSEFTHARDAQIQGHLHPEPRGREDEDANVQCRPWPASSPTSSSRSSSSPTIPKSASEVIECATSAPARARQSAIIETIEKLPDPTIVRSWTGTLAGLETNDTYASPVDFKVPMKWSEWKRTWRSEPPTTSSNQGADAPACLCLARS